MTLTAGVGSTAVTFGVIDDAIHETADMATDSAAPGQRTPGSATITIPASDVPVLGNAKLYALALAGVNFGTFDAATTGYATFVSHVVA